MVIYAAKIMSQLPFNSVIKSTFIKREKKGGVYICNIK